MRCEACGCDCAEKDAEVERLLTKHEKEKHFLLTVLDKQTTEIERLKALLKRAAEALDNGDLAILDEMREATK